MILSNFNRVQNLLLDEGTSALESENESAVKAALDLVSTGQC